MDSVSLTDFLASVDLLQIFLPLVLLENNACLFILFVSTKLELQGVVLVETSEGISVSYYSLPTNCQVHQLVSAEHIHKLLF